MPRKNPIFWVVLFSALRSRVLLGFEHNAEKRQFNSATKFLGNFLSSQLLFWKQESDILSPAQGSKF